jgi:hypothetical protein
MVRYQLETAPFFCVCPVYVSLLVLYRDITRGKNIGHHSTRQLYEDRPIYIFCTLHINIQCFNIVHNFNFMSFLTLYTDYDFE